MNQEMKNRLLRLNTEALVEMIDGICGQMGMDFHFGQDPCDCIDNPIFYVYGGPHVGTFTVLNYDPVLHDKSQHKIDMAKDHEHLVRVEAPYCEMCDLLGEGIATGHITAYEVIQSPALKQKQDNGCGCYGDPPCKGCAPKTYLPIDDVPTSFCDNCGQQDYSDKMHHHGSSPTDTSSANKGESVTLCSRCARNFDEQGLSEDEKTIDITPTWPEMVRIIAALMESGTDTGKRAAFDELKRMADVMTTYRIQRDEAIIHANNIIREARSIVVPSRMSTSGYWNAVDNFRRFESKTT